MVSVVVILLSLVFCLYILLPVKAQVLTSPTVLTCGINLELTCSLSETFDSGRSRYWVGPSGNTLVNDGISSDVSKYEEDISNAATTNSFILRIKNVAVADAGAYTCTYKVTTSPSKTVPFECANGEPLVSRKDDGRREITIDQVYPSTSTITVSANNAQISGTTSNIASTTDTSLYKFTWVSTESLSEDTFDVVINTGTVQTHKTGTFTPTTVSDDGLSTGEIVGIVVGVVGSVIIITVIIIVLYKKKRLCFAEGETKLSKKRGSTVLLVCPFPKANLPGWIGPHSLDYTIEGTAGFNPALSSDLQSRLSMKDFKDLQISNLANSDGGTYKCSVTGTGEHTITLTVTEPTTKNRDNAGSSGGTGGAVAMSSKDKEKLPPIKGKKTTSVRPQPTVVREEDEREDTGSAVSKTDIYPKLDGIPETNIVQHRSLPVPPSGPKTRGLSANFEEFPNIPSKKLAPIESEMIIEEEEDRKKKKKKKKSRKSDDDE